MPFPLTHEVKKEIKLIRLNLVLDESVTLGGWGGGKVAYSYLFKNLVSFQAIKLTCLYVSFFHLFKD